MIYKAVVFDLDGTLLDTLEDIGDSANRVLEAQGLPVHDMEKYKYFVGDGVAKLIDRMVPEDKKTPETLALVDKLYREDYGKNWTNKSAPYKGIPELLDLLEKKGLKTAVLSNKPHEITLKCVDMWLNAWEFDVIMGQKDTIPRKPNPAGAKILAKKLGVKPSEILYLGDTNTDMQTANGAGMYAVGVTWGFRPKEELLAEGAQLTIDSPMELSGLLS